MSIDHSKVRGLVRAIAYDLKGARLGRVAQVFLDDRTDEPAWVAVDVTRVRGMRLLPLAGAGLHGKHLVIRAEGSTVRSAPRIDLGDGQLSSQDESRLLEHYGLTPAGRHEAPPDTDQRPVSPWPDDTERETAWERPAEASGHAQDTQAFPPPVAQGWEQPSESSGTAGNSAAIGEDAREGDDRRGIPSGRSDTEPATMTSAAEAVPPAGSDEEHRPDQRPEPPAAPPPPGSPKSPPTAPQAAPQPDAQPPDAPQPDAPPPPPDAQPPDAQQPDAQPPAAPQPAAQQPDAKPPAPPTPPDPAPVSPARSAAPPEAGASEPKPDPAPEPSTGRDGDPR